LAIEPVGELGERDNEFVLALVGNTADEEPIIGSKTVRIVVRDGLVIRSYGRTSTLESPP